MQNSKQLQINATIKSKYLKSNQTRRIIVSPLESHIKISNSTNFHVFKHFHVDQLKDFRQQDKKISMNFDTGRVYEIQTQRSHLLTQALLHAKNAKLCSRFIEQKINFVPKSINYHQLAKNQASLPSKTQLRLGQLQEQSVQISKKEENQLNNRIIVNLINQKGQIKEKVIYKSQPFLINPSNWKQIKQKGHFILLNQQWKGNAVKIFGFVVKKFLTTGSFMGISFPVFAMKPQSILQSYARSIASASKIFTKTHNFIERIKQFTVFLWTMSMMNITLLKPFNPTIGQTFQADINGGKYEAEQVSHHPPISAFFYEKDNYKIHSSLQLSASIGFNSGQGRFVGDITIQFSDGHWIKGRLPNGQITSILIGETTFQAYGGAYIYDSNKIVFTYEMGGQYIFTGNIGILSHKQSTKFNQILKDNSRFFKFKSFQKDCFAKIFSKFQGRYSQWINFDGKQYANFQNQSLFPYCLQQMQKGLLLKSDSRFRKDLQLLKMGQIEKSQEEKEAIQNVQRANRKLRQKYTK